MPPVPPSNGSATTGFVCGLVGFVICLIPFGIFVGGIVAIVGIVFGFIGRSRAREVGTGRGMATAGAILGILGLIVGVLWLFAFGSIFSKIRNNLEIREGDFIVTPETCRTIGAGTVDATGSVTNTSTFDRLLVQVHLTVRDSRGTIVGRGQDFVGSVDAGSTALYVVTVRLDDPSVREPRCEVTVG